MTRPVEKIFHVYTADGVKHLHTVVGTDEARLLQRAARLLGKKMRDIKLVDTGLIKPRCCGKK